MRNLLWQSDAWEEYIELQPDKKLLRKHWYRVPSRSDYRCCIMIKLGSEGDAVDSPDIM